MLIEIWSDVMCPFCYIGKRRFEEALQQFEYKEEIKIEWKSFQLNPGMKTDADITVDEHLAETKGWSPVEAKRMNQHVTQLARQVGLEYHLEKAVVANSFDAHRLIQYARKQGKDDLAEEALFKAYFTEGRNIADPQTLLQLGVSAGLDEEEVSEVVHSDAYTSEVNQDIEEARRLGIRGVPFFVIDRKFGVSGAQPTEVFVNALNKAWKSRNQNQLTDS